MKELLKLESFQKIVFYLFLTGIIIGVLYGIHIFSGKLQWVSIIPFFPVIYFISKGLKNNLSLFRKDFKTINNQIQA
jgi:hypothetical protein